MTSHSILFYTVHSYIHTYIVKERKLIDFFAFIHSFLLPFLNSIAFSKREEKSGEDGIKVV